MPKSLGEFHGSEDLKAGPSPTLLTADSGQYQLTSVGLINRMVSDSRRSPLPH